MKAIHCYNAVQTTQKVFEFIKKIALWIPSLALNHYAKVTKEANANVYCNSFNWIFTCNTTKYRINDDNEKDTMLSLATGISLPNGNLSELQKNK